MPLPNTSEPELKYAGYEQDESGLYYANARYYASGEGRFTTPDVLGGSPAWPQSLNGYAYCLGNPVNLVDPSGMRTKTRKMGSHLSM